MKSTGDAIHCRCGMDFHVPELPNLARTWNCPSCAGSVDPSKNKCDYCDAYLAFARCPACFSIAPYDEAKHCAECGESLTLPFKKPPEKNSTLPCPRCEGSLVKKVIDKHTVDLCKSCGGVWLEHHQLSDVLGIDSISKIAKSEEAEIFKSSNSLPRQAVKYLACPECNDIMDRHNFMRYSNVILDKCNKHGVWFDKHELAAVMDYLHNRPEHSKVKNVYETEDTKRNISNGDIKRIKTKKHETFEIQDEDLELLLKEFPELTTNHKS